MTTRKQTEPIKLDLAETRDHAEKIRAALCLTSGRTRTVSENVTVQRSKPIAL